MVDGQTNNLMFNGEKAAGAVGDVAGSPEVVLRSDFSVDLVTCSATDMDVVRAARVSTVGSDSLLEEKGKDYCTGLINYMIRNRHGSPFEHNLLTFYVEAPIFTVRHLMRHRMWSFNEESARYRQLYPVFYLPDSERALRQEGKPGEYRYLAGTSEDHRLVRRQVVPAYRTAWSAYTAMLGAGVSREIARTVLPSGIYTSLYATCNARALMHFLSLRTRSEEAKFPSYPQYEIDRVARQMEQAWSARMPITHLAFDLHGRVAP
ncbi:thymidylate synthase (FAD) [Amycolatopsis tolypomycina]|uniref:Flavin-dependent thymidylate synthase n=1 Tax=Amycolatopsis tolypomycina TaxID=208445 RepID=A0A1H4YTS6_9PSEU|nr:FAD-dependent thymidylate synthase [Amycolatopsis tolypomycina]SED21496.1 thymidylate synthase (FAD) [Amycolatopsis tolypomycina]